MSRERDVIDPFIREKVENVVLNKSVQDYIITLKPIYVTLDTLQRINANLSNAVTALKKLRDKFLETVLDSSQVLKFYKRYKQ